MRLTLRTLLAYLDDILDPADKEELNRKVESSDFASDLILRTRDTMRRLRLSAPQVVGTGMGLDPNTVAEYLDNSLPPDQVGDFERICLESDMHLAEVAACHHVLTMVLGSPADVDPQGRNRMYAIPQQVREGRHLRADSAHAPSTMTIQPPTATTSVVAAPAPDGRATTTAYASPEIPDYLRTSVWSRYRGVMIAAAVVLVAATLLIVAGLGGWFDRGAQTVAVSPAPLVAPAETAAAADEPLARGAPDEAATTPPMAEAMGDPRPDAPSEGAWPLDEPTQPAAETDRYAVAPDQPPATPEAPAADADLPAPASPTDDAAWPTDPIEPVAPAADPALDVLLPDVPAEVDRDVRLPDEAAARLPDDLPAAPGGPVVTPFPDTPEAPPAEPEGVAVTPLEMEGVRDDEEPPAEDETAPDLGTYLGGKTVLLRWDATDGAWYRMPPRSAVATGDRLLALPEFRPKLTFASGIHLDVSGGTQILVDSADRGTTSGLAAAHVDVPAIDVVYGRVVLLNTSSSDNVVRLTFGGATSADVRLARNATLGIEVTRPFVPGLDPRKAAVPVEVSLYAPDGGVVWQDASGEMKVDESSHWTIVDSTSSEVTDDPTLPEWIDSEPTIVRSERLYGMPAIEETLTTDRPANLQLLELYQSGDRRRREVRSLAARSSIHVGLFVPFVQALRDSQQRPNWSTHIDTLRSAMALGPEAAEGIWQTLVEQRGTTAAADLYEMLCGYDLDQIGRTPEQVRGGAIARLIDRLENDNLDYRVLAVHNLRQITGKELLRNPAGNMTERAQGVRRWRSRLERDPGDLMPRDQ